MRRQDPEKQDSSFEATQPVLEIATEKACKLRDDFIQQRGLWDEFCTWVRARPASLD